MEVLVLIRADKRRKKDIETNALAFKRDRIHAIEIFLGIAKLFRLTVNLYFNVRGSEIYLGSDEEYQTVF